MTAFGRFSVLLALSQVAQSSAYVTRRIGDACLALSAALPGRVSYPNSTLYAISNNYWSENQAEVHPACFVGPESPVDVSAAVKLLTSLPAPFTVKGGGHTAFAGGSNIADGVTIDLAKLNSITVSEDRSTVSVGPGNRWINVSTTLDPLGLAVVGGRVSDVGVSGLILGGGISYFSGRHGWACDNVRNFEVVLASGEIVDASPSVNPDLYWGLRGGGGSNFGVVTRFDLAAFEQGDLWLYSPIYPLSSSVDLLPPFVDLITNGLPADHDAHTFFVMTYVPQLGGYSIVPYFYHATLPLTADDTPAVFSEMKAVPGAILNSTTVANVSTHSVSISEPYGGRRSWWDTSVKATSPELLQDFIPLFQTYADNLLSAAAAINDPLSPFFVYQPISSNILEAMQKNGGNALGLTPDDGPLVIVQITIHWENSELDDLITSTSKDLIDQFEQLADERGLLNGFKYINYAGKIQDVYGGYGPESQERLRSVAQTYDPDGLLKDLWKGYFKV